MGPHFFKCGKKAKEGKATQFADALQWGRTFSSAESAERMTSKKGAERASMGPHFFKCGKKAR